MFEYSPNEQATGTRTRFRCWAGSGWIIRDNLIQEHPRAGGEEAGPAVLAWFSASRTTVEGNTFINCQREISFGLIARTTPNDHTGGMIRNNFIYRDASVTGGDVAIAVFDSPSARVLHNSVYIAALVSERHRVSLPARDRTW